jgi:hypothetical protein
MRWTFRAFGIAMAIAATASTLSAQTRSSSEQENNIPYGTKSGEFLLLPVGGRATAMGNAFTALAEDVSALYWNPAGIASMQNRGAMISYINYVADTHHVWFGFVAPFSGGDRAIGIHVGSFGFTDQPEYTVDQPDGTGRTYSVTMSEVGVTMSQKFTDRFNFGVTGKIINESLGGASASTWAVDIGTAYHTTVSGRPIRGAFTITNLGGQLKHTGSPVAIDLLEPDPNLPPGTKVASFQSKAWDLPVAFRVGVAYDAMASSNNRLTLAGEFQQPSGNDVSGSVGAEYALKASSGFNFALRGGYYYTPDNNVDSSLSSMNGSQGDGLSLGGGIGYALSERSSVGVDYAWRKLGLLGNQQLFSVSIGF